MPHCPRGPRRQHLAGPGVVRRRLRVGPVDVRGERRVGRVGPALDAVRRVPDPAGAGRRRRGAARRRGRRRGVGRPAAVLARRDATRLRLGRDGLVERLGRGCGRRARATVARRAARPRGTDVVTGSTLVRLVARRIGDRDLPQRGRLRPPRRRDGDRGSLRDGKDVASCRRVGTTRSTGDRTASSRRGPARAHLRPSRSSIRRRRIVACSRGARRRASSGQPSSPRR